VNYVLVAAFGAVGAVCRYALDGWVTGLTRGQFPWGTMSVNIIGSFALGIVVALTTERLVSSPQWRIALGIGFIGAFTTFSTYAYETVKLAEDGAVGLALANALGMLALGFAAAAAGLAVGRAI
jgi:fluoride exporter